MTFILGWIVFAVLVGVLANRRGRNGVGWFFLSLIISPLIAGLFVLVLDPLRPSYAQIAAIAAVEATPANSHARQLLEQLTPQAKRQRAECKNQRLIGVLILLAVVGFMALGSFSSQAPVTPGSSASQHEPAAPASRCTRDPATNIYTCK